MTKKLSSTKRTSSIKKNTKKAIESLKRIEQTSWKAQYNQDPNIKRDCSKMMSTFSGNYVDPRNLSPDEIDIRDIAHGLSNLCRFAGQCKVFYSVAEHSFLASWAVWEKTKDKELALTALLHDAPEAYIGDLVRCVKVGLPDYQTMEDKIWEVICLKFRLNIAIAAFPHLPGSVKEADYRMLVTERRILISDKSAVWDLEEQYQPYDMSIKGLTPAKAKELFLDAFESFSGRSIGARE